MAAGVPTRLAEKKNDRTDAVATAPGLRGQASYGFITIGSATLDYHLIKINTAPRWRSRTSAGCAIGGFVAALVLAVRRRSRRGTDTHAARD